MDTKESPITEFDISEPATGDEKVPPRVRHRSRSLSSLNEPESPSFDEDLNKTNANWPVAPKLSASDNYGLLPKPSPDSLRKYSNLNMEADHTVKSMPVPVERDPESRAPHGPISVRSHKRANEGLRVILPKPQPSTEVFPPLSDVPVTAPVQLTVDKLKPQAHSPSKSYSSVNMLDKQVVETQVSEEGGSGGGPSNHNSSTEFISAEIWDKIKEANLNNSGAHGMQRSRDRSPDPKDLGWQNGVQTWGKPRFGRPAGASDDEESWADETSQPTQQSSKYSSGGAFAYLRQTFKHKLAKYQQYIDRAAELLAVGEIEAIIHGLSILGKVLYKAWSTPKYGHDLAYSLCDYLRQYHGILDIVVRALIDEGNTDEIRIAAARALEEMLSMPNRKYLAERGLIEKIANTVKAWNEPPEKQRVAVSIVEHLFKLSPDTSMMLIDLCCLDFILNACKSMPGSQTSRHVALALANLAMYSDHDCQEKMINKKVQDWLFLLASVPDPVTRYYACLAICMLVSNKELEAAVIKSGTLSLVEPFLLAHKPNTFATCDYKRSQGRPKEWLEKLVLMLTSKRKEPRSLAAFHFAMEATVKKEQDRLDVFQIGFSYYAVTFGEQMVDGDLLLLLSENELEKDIGMSSGLLRKRFMRELEDLKISADYSCLDETSLDRFLMSLSPDLSNYTYQLLQLGVDRNFLPNLTEEQLATVCGITNPVHRMRLANALLECQHCDDAEVAVLSKHIDIFISYRRSNGNQLASLIKVLLQLKGYKVFIDVDRLYAGKFDTSLLKNIQAAKHFVLVLSAGSLDRLLGDDMCEDWVHKEVLCALQHNKNVVPIFDADFVWPDETLIPNDIRAIARFNGVRWVHEYQEACVSKLEQFLLLNQHSTKDVGRPPRPYVTSPGVSSGARYALPRPGSASVLNPNMFNARMTNMSSRPTRSNSATIDSSLPKNFVNQNGQSNQNGGSATAGTNGPNLVLGGDLLKVSSVKESKNE